MKITHGRDVLQLTPEEYLKLRTLEGAVAPASHHGSGGILTAKPCWGLGITSYLTVSTHPDTTKGNGCGRRRG